MENFPCTGCSLCCRTVGRIHSDGLKYPKDSIVYKATVAFPYKWDEAGCCEMLENNLCSIYEDRPLLCNVKQLGQLIAHEANTDLNSVYKLAADACNNLISAYNLDPSFMIDASQFQ